MRDITLASKIKEVRKHSKMTQADFAKALGVSRSAVSMWETNNAKPTVDNLICIIRITGVDKHFFSDALASEMKETSLNTNTTEEKESVDLADVTKFNDEVFTQDEKEKILDYGKLILAARK